ncbi:MAG: response regulator [Candidatus Latescibacterota bacterium]
MYHILLIDANSFFSATFATLLRRAGYRVSLAPALAAGRRLHRKDPADLVLLGVYLRDCDGKEYLEALQDTFADTRVVGMLSDRERGELLYPLLQRALGKGRVFHKPFRTEEVLDAIYAELCPQTREACR